LAQDPQININKLPNGVKHEIRDEDRKKHGHKTKIGWYSYTDFAFTKVKPAFERVVVGKESMNSIAKSLGFVNETSLRTTLQNKWWIGIKERTKKRPMSYHEETGERIFEKRQAHENPIVHKTNLYQTPLVSVELFERVQNMLNDNSREHTNWQSNTGQFLGTNFLVCDCGCKLYLKFDSRRGKPPVYVCSSYQQKWRNQKFGKQTTLPVCNFARMRAEKVDAAIWAAALKYFRDLPFLVDALMKSEKTDEAKGKQAELKDGEAKLAELEKRKKGILWAIQQDPEDEDAQKAFTSIKRDIAEMKIRVATLKLEAEPFGSGDVKAIARAIVSRFDGAETWNMEQKRAALNEIVETIRLTKCGPGLRIVTRSRFGMRRPQPAV
jgi:hypothetical protein